MIQVEVFREFAEEITKGLVHLFTRHSGGAFTLPTQKVDDFISRIVGRVLEKVGVVTEAPPHQALHTQMETGSSAPPTTALPSASGTA